MATPIAGSPAAANQAARMANPTRFGGGGSSSGGSSGPTAAQKARAEAEAAIAAAPTFAEKTAIARAYVDSTGSSGGSSTIAAIQQKAAAEAAIAAATTQAEKTAISRAFVESQKAKQFASTSAGKRSQELVAALTAREQITQEAKLRGRGFSAREIRKRLKELGTSSEDLKIASRASREQFKRTGVSVTEQIREKAELRLATREQAQIDIADRIASEPLGFSTINTGTLNTDVKGFSIKDSIFNIVSSSLTPFKSTIKSVRTGSSATVLAAFGEPGKNIFRAGIFSGAGVLGAPTGGSVRADTIASNLEKGKLGIPGQVIAPLIPVSVGEGAVAVGGIKLLAAAPPAVRIGLDIVFGYSEVKTVFDPSAEPADRIRSGIFASLGALGTAFETAPFVKGAFTPFKSGFKPVVVDEAVDVSRLFTAGKADVIKDVGKIDDAFDIRIIPEGKGFGFPISEQKAFIGERATLTTSARDLFLGNTRFKDADNVIIESREAGDLGLFFTPTLGDAGEARVSRLGLQTDLFKPSGLDAQIGFSFEKPQIVVARDVLVTESGRPGTARGVGFPSSELEATILPGQELSGKFIGVTKIKGQEVQIFDAKIVGTGIPDSAPSINIPGLSAGSSGGTTKVNPLSIGGATGGLFGSGSVGGISSGSVSTTTTIRGVPSSTTLSIAANTSRILRTPINLTVPTTSKTSGGSSGGSGSSISPSLPPSIPSLPPSIPSLPPSLPSLTPSLPTRPRSPPTRPTSFTSFPPRPKLPQLKPAKSSRRTGRFGVSVRRGGVFRSIGTGSLGSVVSLGKERVGTTLAATFKLTGRGAKPFKLPGFRTKVTKGGVLFIEKRGKRLSKKGETKEIQTAKRKKKKKKKGGKK